MVVLADCFAVAGHYELPELVAEVFKAQLFHDKRCKICDYFIRVQLHDRSSAELARDGLSEVLAQEALEHNLNMGSSESQI